MSDPAFTFRSQPVIGPIEEMGILERSLLFAELSEVAYLAEKSAATVVDDIGLRETLFRTHRLQRHQGRPQRHDRVGRNRR